MEATALTWVIENFYSGRTDATDPAAYLAKIDAAGAAKASEVEAGE